MKNKGLLLVVSAPSGCGKGTILGEILKDDSFYYSISATTRAPREGEQDGVNYHFITKEEFEQRIAQGGMLEYAQYCGNYYGTPKKEVEQMRDAGRDVILEIEVEGAMKVRALCPDAVFLFIAPPSVEELRRRLNKRGTEAAEVIEERVSPGAFLCRPVRLYHCQRGTGKSHPGLPHGGTGRKTENEKRKQDR